MERKERKESRNLSSNSVDSCSVSYFFQSMIVTNNVLHLGIQFALVLDTQFVITNETISSLLLRYKFRSLRFNQSTSLM
jgi:hypothetical protein